VAEVNANMAGTILEILVNVGEKVTEGEDVAMFESMKMQMMFQSNISGTVMEVKVNPGDFVNEGDVILLVE